MTTQLRGEALQVAVRNTIREMAKKFSKSGRIKIDMSALAKAVGTSRPTLYKMREFIDECVFEFKAERRLADGSSARMALDRKVATLQTKINKLSRELEGMRRCHAELYRKLYANSSDLAALVKPVLVKALGNKCILCGLETHGYQANQMGLASEPRKHAKLPPEND